ncbi:MAG: flippase-like domain-containing protein [Chloroflexota bacterium]|nr:flippase-like domain-containing protein [Chloroflexota bacterium]
MSIRKIGLGLLVSLVCLYFVLRGVQWRDVWDNLSHVDPPLFLLSMLLMLLAYFLMTWRWRHLLDPLELPAPPVTQASAGVPTRGVRGYVGLMNLYGKVLTGYFFNAFFPARAGDVVRAYLLGRKTGLTKTTILATIVIEKAFDGLTLLLMLLLSLLFLPATGVTNGVGLSPAVLAWAAGISLILAVVGLAFFYRHSDMIARAVDKLSSMLPLPVRLRHMPARLVETFAGGMHVFKSPLPLISAALISLLVWATVALMFFTALMSFKAPFPVDLTGLVGLFFLTSVVNLGLLIPALPGNVGTYEALCIAAMAFFKVDKELAVAFALIFHVGQLITTLLVGVLAFWAQNLSLKEMRPVEEAAEQEAEKSLLDADHIVEHIEVGVPR